MVQIRKMLEMKRDEVGLRVVAEQRRLALLQTRLEQVERDDSLLAYEVTLKRVDAQRVASVREVLPRYSDVGRLFGELGAYRQRHGIVATAWTAVWYDPEHRENGVDSEATFTTEDRLPEDGEEVLGDKSAWKWTLMILQPEWVTEERFGGVLDSVRQKKGLSALPGVRFECFREGRAAQVMHVGPFADEGPTIERIDRFIGQRGGEMRGKHHEIYLSDFRRTAPERLKTIIRHPFG